MTPAHDPNDFEIGRRHDLPNITVMDERAVITVPGPFQGLDRYEARSAIVAALRADGRIVAEKRPYVHSVGHCSRCKTTVEPRLSLQWWVKVGPLAKAAGDAVRDGRVAIHPKEMESRYFAWVDNLNDWCISRQLWWGHRIPVWHGPDGETVCVGPNDEPPTGEGWSQDTDVLDTWFSSGLWPFSTLGWPEQTPSLEKFYPNSVLVTGYDILFFWVARMMMFGLYAMDGTPPFHTIALHGMVRDQFGKKMSKSFGNAVNPLDWMDTYGSDAVRFTLARGANPGVDVPIGEDWVQGSRNFANKIWNATRFAMMNGATVEGPLPDASEMSATDRWILSRLNETVAQVDAYYEDYQFAKLSDALFHFAWDEVFDWYVELSKTTFFAGGDQAKVSGRVLGEVLDVTLRLLHPVVPFVTETLWTTLTGKESVVIADWPPTRASATRPPSGRSSRSSRSSPRSAGSVPTRVCSRPRRSPAARPVGDPARPARGGDPAGAAAPGGGRRFPSDRDPARRGCHGGAGPVRDDRRRGGAQAPDEGPGRGREGEAAGHGQARQRGVPREGPGQRGRQDPRPAGQGRVRHRADQRAAGGSPGELTAAGEAPEPVDGAGRRLCRTRSVDWSRERAPARPA